MDFVAVNHSLNQTYYVEYGAIEKNVKKAIGILKGYKLESLEIKSSSVVDSINIFMEVTFPKLTSYDKGVKKVKDIVEEYVSNLIDNKPKNIEIKINK